MVGAPSTNRRWTFAVVCTDSGAWPASARMLLRAIEKPAAWAAPINSSGLVPGSSSKRLLNEYVPSNSPLATDTVPEPLFRSPRHSAVPSRVAIAPPHQIVVPVRPDPNPQTQRSLYSAPTLGRGDGSGTAAARRTTVSAVTLVRRQRPYLGVRRRDGFHRRAVWHGASAWAT